MPEGNFWRTEIWHPLSVHFPVALLLIATATFLVSFFIKTETRKQWQNAASGLLMVGCLSAWLSVYTGNLADGIVARKICDPTVLKDHQIAALTMAYLFTIASTLIILSLFFQLKPKWKTGLYFVTLVIMLTGSGYLIYAGHTGASLVYQQGAGVNNHSVDCN